MSYVCVGFCSKDVFPSPKSQLHVSGIPVEDPATLMSIKFTESKPSESGYEKNIAWQSLGQIESL